jgi:chemotaxis protein methyltransferase CheR
MDKSPKRAGDSAANLLLAGERTREFSFTERDFELVRERIYRRAGIALKPGKQEMVYSRLARRLRALGLDSFKDYLALLDDDKAPEWQAFINAITTNLTYFFREPHHFQILAKQLALMDRPREIRIWSAGTATGEEAYSIAMTVREAFPAAMPAVIIVASDVDTTVLAEAERGMYRLDRVESLAPERAKRHFLRGTGSQEGFVRVKEELRRLVTFRHINLIDSKWGISQPVHAIFCRNVMIYFDKDTQYRILRGMRDLLAPGGYLYAGHSENFFHAKDLFQLRDRTVYGPVARSHDSNARLAEIVSA